MLVTGMDHLQKYHAEGLLKRRIERVVHTAVIPRVGRPNDNYAWIVLLDNGEHACVSTERETLTILTAQQLDALKQEIAHHLDTLQQATDLLKT